jgi:hypothetical protein
LNEAGKRTFPGLRHAVADQTFLFLVAHREAEAVPGHAEIQENSGLRRIFPVKAARRCGHV